MGGSSSGGRAGPVAAVARTDYAKAPTMLNLQAGMPNQVEAVSNQLGQGFSGAEAGMLDQMNDLYSPMSLLQMSEPMTATQKNFDGKKHNALSTGDATLDALLMGDKAPGKAAAASAPKTTTAFANSGLSPTTAFANSGLSPTTAFANSGLSPTTASANSGLSPTTASANSGLSPFYQQNPQWWR